MNDRTVGEDGLRIDTDSHSSSTDERHVSNATSSCIPLRVNVGIALDRYFRDLNGETPTDLYSMVLGEVERPLFEAVMVHTKGNQCRASELLGINRNTLRKKLKIYDLIG